MTSSLIHLSHPLCVQRREAGTRKGNSLFIPCHARKHHFPGLCPLTHQLSWIYQKTSGSSGSSSHPGRQKALLPLVVTSDHCIVPSTLGSWTKSMAWDLQSRTISPSSTQLPLLIKSPRTVSPCPLPHIPSTSYHSRISYVKVGPNFIHVAARNLPSPQELLQFQNAGARRGFLSPQHWDGGFSHGPGQPTHPSVSAVTPLCLSSVISPSRRLAGTGGTEASDSASHRGLQKEQDIFSSQVTPLTSNPVTTWNQSYLGK